MVTFLRSTKPLLQVDFVPRPLRCFTLQQKPLLVIGTGPDWEKDVSNLKSELFDVMTINAALVNYPGRVDHFTTHHPERIEKWCSERDLAGGNMDFITHTSHALQRRGYNWRVTGSEGTSSLYGVCIGFMIGYVTIVCAGCPMKGHKNYEQRFHRHNWLKVARKAKGRLFSMSGWTAELLGRPPFSFLSG